VRRFIIILTTIGTAILVAGSPASQAATVMPDGVPASWVGGLFVNDGNTGIWNDYTQGNQGGANCQPDGTSTDGTYALHSDGVALGVSGADSNCAELISRTQYTAGIFEARIYFDGGGGSRSVADWPAYWMTGVNDWPASGEMDAAEGLQGCLSITYHWGSPGSPQNTTPDCYTAWPGWHTVDIVRGFGRNGAPCAATTAAVPPGCVPQDWIFMDGALAWTAWGYVTNAPENIIFDLTDNSAGGQTGINDWQNNVPDAMGIAWVRIWGFA
jgi:hypothetical protein